MRYKAVFIAGVAAGFVAGARAGRGAYDKIVGYGQQVAAHPKVQQATSTAQAKATQLAKSAAAKAPEAAKNAAASAAKVAQAQVSQVPQYVSSAKQAAAGKIPARFGGSAGSGNGAGSGADGAESSATDEVAPDGNLVYPADSVNGTRYSTDTP